MNENKDLNSSKELNNKPNEEERSLEKLTDQNWLFINAFLQTGNVLKSYELAGYKGKNRSAPYQLFKQLKSRIEDLGNLDVTSRARLQADLKQVLDLPLMSDKKELSLSEWLRVRKFVASITPEATQAKPQISVLIINRPTRNNQMDPPIIDIGNSNPLHFDDKDVIDV